MRLEKLEDALLVVDQASQDRCRRLESAVAKKLDDAVPGVAGSAAAENAEGGHVVYTVPKNSYDANGLKSHFLPRRVGPQGGWDRGDLILGALMLLWVNAAILNSELARGRGQSGGLFFAASIVIPPPLVSLYLIVGHKPVAKDCTA